MPSVQRVGDTDSAGGAATGGIGSVRVNGRNIIVNGNSVTRHPPCPKPSTHCSATTSNGSGSVRAGGIPVVYTGASDICGHARTGGSPNVKVAA